MISDRVRTDAFLKAMERVVDRDSVVVDIGTGTGIFALSACRLGARHVYAIEPDDVIEVARRIAADNGLSDRITFLQDTSLAVDLPERADVIVSDIGGLLPYYDHHIPSIVDARERWLSAGGALIPAADVLRCAVVETPETYQQTIGAWADTRFGLDMQAGQDLAVNIWHQERVREEQLLSDIATLSRIDYATVGSPDLDAETGLVISREATAHGLLVWFDREVARDIHLFNAPGAPAAVAPQLIYGTAFFPWSSPADVQSGDHVTVRLRANFVDGDYVWRWSSRVAPARSTAVVGSIFSQSTFYSVPLSKRKLRARAGTFEPTLNEDGRFARYVLDLMNGELSLEEIATRVNQTFPDRFIRPADALDAIGELSLKFGA